MEELRPWVANGQNGDAQPANGKDDKTTNDCQTADQPPFLGDGRQGKIRVDDRDIVGRSLADTLAQDAACRLRI